MSTPGSAVRRTALHPLLAVLAVAVGITGMMLGSGLFALVVRAATGYAIGLRTFLAVAEVLLALPGVLLLLLARIPLGAGLAARGVGTRTVALALLAGAALWMASLGLMNVQFVFVPPPPEFLDEFRRLHQALRPSGPADAVLSVLAIAVMPALCEETLFRGIVLPSMLRVGGVTVALLASAGLFALIHIDPGGAFHRVPFAFAVGLGLGMVRLRTGSLVPSMLAHGAINGITFATVFLTGAAAQAVDEPNLLVGVGFLLTGAAATALLLHTLRGR